jgi:hypothetical protein
VRGRAEVLFEGSSCASRDFGIVPPETVAKSQFFPI